MQETIKLVPHRDLILEDCIACVPVCFACSFGGACNSPVRFTCVRLAAVQHGLAHTRACSYIADDELVEVTPKIVRLRKKKLDPTERKKLVRQTL